MKKIRNFKNKNLPFNFVTKKDFQLTLLFPMGLLSWYYQYLKSILDDSGSW